MRPQSVQVVAVLGAECTGKSTLSQALGRALPAYVVPEYLRHWCLDKGRPPTAPEQGDILQGQRLWLQRALHEADRLGLNWVVCDCAPLLTAAYSIEYFDDDSLLAQSLEAHRGYHHTLLTSPAIDWRPDGFLRDGESMRQRVDARLRALLAAHTIACTAVEGSPQAREKMALEALMPSGPRV